MKKIYFAVLAMVLIFSLTLTLSAQAFTPSEEKVVKVLPVPMSLGVTATEIKAIVKRENKKTIAELKKIKDENKAFAEASKTFTEVGKAFVDVGKVQIEATKSVGTKIDKLTKTLKEKTGLEAKALGEQIYNNTRLTIGSIALAVLLLILFFWLICRRGRRVLEERSPTDNMVNLIIGDNDRTRTEVQAVAESVLSVASDVREIQGELATVRRVVKPDPFTLKFNVGGEKYEYDVPVNSRGKFVSLYAPKVDPGDKPDTPANTLRASFDDERDLEKSCKSAIKEYQKPAGNKIQKDLVDHLLSTKVLRKI